MRLMLALVATLGCSGGARRDTRPPPPRGGPMVIATQPAPVLALEPRSLRIATAHTYSCSIEDNEQILEPGTTRGALS